MIAPEPGDEPMGSDPRYRTFNISKRSGGFRQIEAPKPDLKLLQHDVLRSLRRFSPSPFSYGVSRGARMCAAAHASSSIVVRMDVQSFFPSITKRVLSRDNLLHRMAAEMDIDPNVLSDIIFFDDVDRRRLAQGAPTSPMLADLAMKSFDFSVARTIARNAFDDGFDASKIAFTRYVDDVLVSTCEPLLGNAVSKFSNLVELAVREALTELSLVAAEKKTKAMRAKAGEAAFCVGFSVAGRNLQVSRAMRERARKVCWRITHGNRVSATDRGVLAYALQGRFRVPRRLLLMIENSVLEPRLASWLQGLISRASSRNLARAADSGLVSTLARSALHRAMNAVGEQRKLHYDLALIYHLGQARISSDGFEFHCLDGSPRIAIEGFDLAVVMAALRSIGLKASSSVAQ